MSSDRIEKQIVLNAPREKVWRAISESTRFGAWFGVAFDGPFVEGRPLTGRITPTEVDPEVAKLQEPARGFRFSVFVERIQPMERFLARERATGPELVIGPLLRHPEPCKKTTWRFAHFRRCTKSSARQTLPSTR